jgi:drug/metabolite transporter (DMT)-like permease
MKQRTSPRGLIQAASGMTIVGTLTAVSATIARYPVYGGQAVRYAVAAVILLLVVRLRDRAGRPSGSSPARSRPTVREWALITVLAATGLAGFNVCVVEGTRHTTPATIGTVVGTVPIVLAIVVPLLERRRPAPRLVLSAVVVTLGAVVADGLGGGSASGLLLALGALVGEIAFSLLAVPLLPGLGPVRVSAYSAAAAAPMLLGAGLITDGTAAVRVPTAGEAAGFGYLTIVVTVGAFVLWYDALGRIGADRAGLFAGLIPVSAAATAMLLGLGAPGPAELTGVLLVGCGVTVGLGGSKDRPATTAPAPGRGEVPVADASRCPPEVADAGPRRRPAEARGERVRPRGAFGSGGGPF